MTLQTDIISIESAHDLSGLFQERVRRTPDAVAYRQFDEESQTWQQSSWREMAHAIDYWRTALASEKLNIGDCVAIMLKNCKEWVYFDQAALSLGLVTVPLYPNDHAENAAYILENSDAKLLLVGNLSDHSELVQHPIARKLVRIISLEHTLSLTIENAKAMSVWLSRDQAIVPPLMNIDSHSLASIVYTSGTTGPPKGVMLSHHNMLWNAWSGLQSLPIAPTDHFLSFLPLSHTLERSIGYYLPIMAGAMTTYARSIPQLAEDLLEQKPTVLISVPRIYERIYNKVHEQLKTKPDFARKLFLAAVDIGWLYFENKQNRSSWKPRLLAQPILKRLVANKIQHKLGGRLRIAICGGAPLSETIAKTFIGLGIPLFQGYGLTETSPVISVNTANKNLPKSIGLPLQDVEVKFSESNELLVKSPGVMQGYWKNKDATQQTIDADGWLHTGDLGLQDSDGFLHITGRLKDIIVLATGEKIPPADMEMAISMDPYIEHVLVIGEGRPYLTALVVLTQAAWHDLAEQAHLDSHSIDSLQNNSVFIQTVLQHVQQQVHQFPSYANILAVAITSDPWTVDNNLVTPTLKPKRSKILDRYQTEIEALYHGH